MAAPLELRVDDLRGPEVRALLEEHLAFAHEASPPGAVHALDLDALRRPDVTFWTAWTAGALAGCAALRELDATHGEVKSMRTARSHLRRGVARALLEHVIATARRRGYRRLSLETGNTDAFAPARRLYEQFGFVVCPPFADYVSDGFSVCMTREL